MRAFEQRKKNSPASSGFFGPKIQKKLKTGTVGDKYEVEADKAADKVVNKSSSAGGLLQSKPEEEIQQKSISETISSVQTKEMKEEEPLQKKEEEKEPIQKKDEEKEATVQAKCADCEKEDKVQKKENEEDKAVQSKEQQSNTDVNNNKLEGKLNSSKGNGTALDKNTKSEMESGFGSDFSNVKIHTDTNAVQMSQELGAQAFTNGNDVYFNDGKYKPDSKEGKHLLAHELTHTIQQTGMVQKSAMENHPGNHPEDLQNPENPYFKGNPPLEKANDNEMLITTGHKGDYVTELQTGLLEWRQDSLPNYGADGDFGSETRNAVLDFQIEKKLNDKDGIVGPETMGTLDNALVEKGNKKEPNTKNCGEAVSLTLSDSCYDYMNTCITEAFTPSKSSKLTIEIDVDYMTPQPAWIAEDVSIQVMKCGFIDDTRIGEKRVSTDNIPLKMKTEIASVTAGDKYYVVIHSRSSAKLKTYYTISQ